MHPFLFLYLVESVNSVESDTPAECSLCKYVVTFVDTFIENNRTEEAVEAALEKVCTILPPALNGSCVNFVEDFGPILLQLIEKYDKPKEVCDAIRFCHNGTVVAETKSRKFDLEFYLNKIVFLHLIK
jgi:hypothetical protein